MHNVDFNAAFRAQREAVLKAANYVSEDGTDWSIFKKQEPELKSVQVPESVKRLIARKPTYEPSN